MNNNAMGKENLENILIDIKSTLKGYSDHKTE